MSDRAPRMAACLLLLCTVMADGASGGIERLVESTQRGGSDIQLPENLSRVLGVGRAGHRTPAKQATVRDSGLIRTFNVCRDDPDHIVILTYDESVRVTKAYLMSPQGKMMKAVSYVAGGSPEVRTSAEARSDFDAAMAFWLAFRLPG